MFSKGAKQGGVCCEKNRNLKSFKNLIFERFGEIADLRFERIVGRNVLQKHADKSGFLETLKPWISADGFFVFGETVPALGQRLSDLIPEKLLKPENCFLCQTILFQDGRS